MEKIGNMLKEKRIELGMSVEDISEKTRLTTKHIKALEEGDISFFHEDLSYLRFFVKSYCDAVGIDFEDMKDELRESIDDYTMTSPNSPLPRATSPNCACISLNGTLYISLSFSYPQTFMDSLVLSPTQEPSSMMIF